AFPRAGGRAEQHVLLTVVLEELAPQASHHDPMGLHEVGPADLARRRPARRAQHLGGVLTPTRDEPGQAREHRHRGHPIQEFPWVALAPLTEVGEDVQGLHHASCTSQRTSQCRCLGGTGGGTHGVGGGIGPYSSSYVAILRLGAVGSPFGVACASMALMMRSTMRWICCWVCANCAWPSASTCSSSTRC